MRSARPDGRWRGRARSSSAAALALVACSACQSLRPTPTPNVGWPGSASRDRRVDEALEWAEAELRSTSAFETLIGSRSFDDGARWEPIDDQLDLGIGLQVPFLGDRTVTLERPTDWLSWDLGLAYAFDRSERTAATVESQIVDLSVGLLAQPPDPRIRLKPFIGAGWNTGFARAEVDVGGGRERERDVVGGPYARAGLRFFWEPRRFFGAEVRWRAGDDDNPVDLIGGRIESTSLSIVFGTTF